MIFLLRYYNEYPRCQLTVRQVNGRLVLEGVLRIYWGTDHSIRLKQYEDNRVINRLVNIFQKLKIFYWFFLATLDSMVFFYVGIKDDIFHFFHQFKRFLNAFSSLNVCKYTEGQSFFISKRHQTNLVYFQA